jgi:hypothetical protein
MKRISDKISIEGKRKLRKILSSNDELDEDQKTVAMNFFLIGINYALEQIKKDQ